MHVRFNSLRGLLLGLVEDSGFTQSPVTTWSEHDGRISNVTFSTTPPLIEWPVREQIRAQAHEGVLDLVATIRAEVQGGKHRGCFVGLSAISLVDFSVGDSR